MSRHILVTGGAGFIGSHLVDRLVADGHEVTIVDNLEPQVHKTVPSYLNLGAEYILADIRNTQEYEHILKDVDVVFHEAAAVGIGQSMYEIDRYVDVNSLGTAKLLNLLANSEHDVKKLIVASSMSIYGEGSYLCPECGVVNPGLRAEGQLKAQEWDAKCPRCYRPLSPRPTGETRPLSPTSIYAITKRDQEEMALTVGATYGIPTVALRYFNTYGPRQSLSNPYTGVCAIFSARIVNGRPPIVYEDGLQTRDFVSVRDVVEANVLALESNTMDNGAFNVGTGQPSSVLDIANALIELYGADVTPEVVHGYRAGDIRHCYADITRISSCGYRPRVDLKEGLRELVEWGRHEEAVDKVDAAQEILVNKKLITKPVQAIPVRARPPAGTKR